MPFAAALAAAAIASADYCDVPDEMKQALDRAAWSFVGKVTKIEPLKAFGSSFVGRESGLYWVRPLKPLKGALPSRDLWRNYDALVTDEPASSSNYSTKPSKNALMIVFPEGDETTFHEVWGCTDPSRLVATLARASD